MRFEQIVLILAGLAIICSFFLPAFNIPGELLDRDRDLSISGYQFAQSILDNFDVIEYDGGKPLEKFVGEMWGSMNDFKDMGLAIGLMFILGLPVYFVLYGLGYMIRGLRGKQYGKGIFFTILTMGAGYLVFRLIGMDQGVSMNFFKVVDLGYWVAFGGMIVAAFSLFFEKKAK